MDKIKIFFKRNIAYFLTFFIILLFPISAYCLLVKKDLITEEAFYSNVLGFAGWIIALFIAWIHIRKNREDNLAIQNSEIKKRLEIEAFKEVNEMIEKINLALADIGTYYGYELIKGLHFGKITLFLDKLQRTYAQSNKQMEDGLLTLWIKFTLKIRAHEIVLIRFNDLKNKLDFKFKESILLVSEFVHYTQKLKTENILPKDEFLKIKNKCEKIDKSLSNLSKGLTDYSNELQNEMLGEIFNSKIPKLKNKEPRRTFAQIISNICKQDK